jgi:rRNA maturation protein Nop10
VYIVNSIYLKDVNMPETPALCLDDHDYQPTAWGMKCTRCAAATLAERTCSLCGESAAVFNCPRRNCPVNGGAAYGP